MSEAQKGGREGADEALDDEGLAEAAADAGAEGEDGEEEGGEGDGEGEEGEGPEGDEDVDYVELVKIHNVRDANEAHLVRTILESFHIPCHTEDAAMDNFGGVLPTQIDGLDILVPASFAERAKAVLCERNIVCGVEEGRLEKTLVLAEGAGEDAGKRATFLAALAEETRDYRHEVIQRLAKAGAPGVKLVRTLMKEALADEARAAVAADVAALANLGAFGKETGLLVLDDLTHTARAQEAGTRKRGAACLGKLRGVGAGAALVEMLSDDDAEVRDEALESLYALSQGETYDFDPALSPASQGEAISRWRAWVRSNPGA